MQDRHENYNSPLRWSGQQSARPEGFTGSLDTKSEYSEVTLTQTPPPPQQTADSLYSPSRSVFYRYPCRVVTLSKKAWLTGWQVCGSSTAGTVSHPVCFCCREQSAICRWSLCRLQQEDEQQISRKTDWNQSCVSRRRWQTVCSQQGRSQGFRNTDDKSFKTHKQVSDYNQMNEYIRDKIY